MEINLDQSCRRNKDRIVEKTHTNIFPNDPMCGLGPVQAVLV